MSDTTSTTIREAAPALLDLPEHDDQLVRALAAVAIDGDRHLVHGELSGRELFRVEQGGTLTLIDA